MGKSKKVKKKKPYEPLLLSPEEENLLNSLLQNTKSINLTNIKEQIPDHRIAQALVERLPVDHSNAVNLVPALRDAFPQKNVQKAIKKAIFRIKQSGISLPALEPQKEAPLLRRIEEEPENPDAYLGPIDGTGNRGVFVALLQMPRDVDLGMGLVNDEEGIIQFMYDRFSKKRMKAAKELFFQGLTHMVDVSLSHAATILERACARNEPGQEELLSGYFQFRPRLLENVILLDQAAIYDVIPRQSVSENVLTDSQIHKLLGHQLMESWIIDLDTIKPVLEQILAVEESRILVSREQKAERINDIKEKGIDEIYPESKRALMRNRLEEMAYIFFKMGEEEYARISLAAALSIEEKSVSVTVNSFLRIMVERGLLFYLESAKEMDQSGVLEDESPSSIIIP